MTKQRAIIRISRRAKSRPIVYTEPSPTKVMCCPEVSKKWFDRPLIGHVFSFATVIASLFSIMIATGASNDQLDLQQELNAYETWERFSEISLENDDVSGSTVADVPKEKLVKFRWFMERFLIASEQIMLSAKGDRQWELAIQFEVTPRFEYFISEDFLGSADEIKSMQDSSFCTYISGLRTVLRDGIIIGYNADAARHSAIQKLHGISSVYELERRLDFANAQCIHPDEPKDASG